MLWNRLLGAKTTNTPQAPGIQYVGGYAQGFAGTTSDVVISLTSLTGGLASAPATGDVVFVYFATGGIANQNLTVSGYSVLRDLYSDDTYDTNLEVAYKVMGATPDTSITLTGGTFSAADAGTVAIQVFRGDLNLYGLTSTTAANTNTGQPNPPAVTPTINGTVVISGGAAGHVGGTLTFTSSNLTNFITVGSNDTYDSTIGMGYHQWISGTFDPAQFGGGTTATSASWAACTVVLPPRTFTPGFVSFAFGQATGNTDQSVSIGRPASIQKGDLLVAFVRWNNGEVNNNAVPAGWAVKASSITSILATKIATDAEPNSYTFGFGADVKISGIILCFRQFDYDTVAANSNNGITPRIGDSYILGFPSSSTASISYSESAFFAENKLFVDNDTSPPSFTVFGKSGVAATATGAITYTPSSGSLLLALRPRPLGPAVEVVATNAVINGTSLTIPAHSSGDWLVVVSGNQTTTPPSLLSGYTDIGTFSGGSRSSRVQYIVSNGSITSVSVPYYGTVAVIRGASAVGQSAFRNSGSSVTTLTLPTISGLTQNVNSLVLGGGYVGTTVTGSNYDVLSSFGMSYSGSKPSSIADATVTYSSLVANPAFIIELLP